MHYSQEHYAQTPEPFWSTQELMRFRTPEDDDGEPTLDDVIEDIQIGQAHQCLWQESGAWHEFTSAISAYLEASRQLQRLPREQQTTQECQVWRNVILTELANVQQVLTEAQRGED